MLVLSRQPGEAVHVSSSDEAWVVTALELQPEQARLQIVWTAAARPGDLQAWVVAMRINDRLRISAHSDLSVIDIRRDKVRLGFDVRTPGSTVHRLEVHEAVRGRNREGPQPGGGPAGAPMPRPSSPTLPTLDVRLDEPPADVEE